jgi:ribonuclease HI
LASVHGLNRVEIHWVPGHAGRWRVVELGQRG